eukprot:scaffold6339_cov112-Isochrysis_galbana.AAC.8
MGDPSRYTEIRMARTVSVYVSFSLGLRGSSSSESYPSCILNLTWRLARACMCGSVPYLPPDGRHTWGWGKIEHEPFSTVPGSTRWRRCQHSRNSDWNLENPEGCCSGQLFAVVVMGGAATP